MSHQLIILSSRKHDPIYQHASTIKSKSIIAISLHDFIENLSINDHMDNNGTRISWLFNDKKIHNDDNNILLNRVFSIESSLFKDTHKNDRDFMAAELQAYIGFAVDHFVNLEHNYNEMGIVITLPLYQQWQRIIHANINIHSPQYYWGDKRFNQLNYNDNISGDIFDITLWNTNIKSHNDILFQYQRPSGTPVFALCINNHVLITQYQLNNKKNISESTLILLSKKIQLLFRYTICETLFFIDNNKITFGNITPHILHSYNNEYFNEFIDKNLFKDYI